MIEDRHIELIHAELDGELTCRATRRALARCCSRTPRRGRFATSSTACSARWRSSRTRRRRAELHASVLSALGAQSGPEPARIRPAVLVRGPGIPLCRRVRGWPARERDPARVRVRGRRPVRTCRSSSGPSADSDAAGRGAPIDRVELDLAQVSGAINSYQLDGQLVVELDLKASEPIEVVATHGGQTVHFSLGSQPDAAPERVIWLPTGKPQAEPAVRDRGVRRRAAPAPGQPSGIPGRMIGVGSLGAERGPNQLFLS